MKKFITVLALLLGAFTGFAQTPEIHVTGNSVTITDGDLIPTTADHTDFGSVLFCSGTIVRTFTIHNTGSNDLIITSVTLSGAEASEYSISTMPVSPVGSGNTTTFQVVFDPAGISLRNAEITIANNDADEGSYNFAIQGTGNADIVNPSITCPAHITTTANFGLCSAVVTYTTPSVVDNCGTPTLVQTTGLPSGSAFPVGVTVNTFVVTDGSGNTANCSFNVTVTDAQAPVLYTMSCTNSNASGTAYNDGWQNGDNDGSGFGAWNLTPSTGNLSQAGFVTGSSITNGSAIDSNGDQDINTSGRALGMYANSAQATQAVRPLLAPLAVGSTIKLEFDNGTVDNGQIVGFQLQNSSGNSLGEVRYRGNQPGYEIVDNNGITAFTSIPVTDEAIIIEVTSTGTGQANIKLTRKVNGVTQTLPFTMFPGGGNQVIQKIKVFNSNAGSGVTNYLYVNNFQVCAPSLGCPANISVSNNTGLCGAVVVYNPVLASDNCATSLTVTQTAGLASGSLFPVGTTTNTFSATDGSGNTATCSFTVIVADTSDPVASCNSFSLMLGNISGSATITAPMINNGSTDNCGIASMSVSPNSFTCANIGPNNVTLTVTDASGNSSVCVGVITVLDTARPNLTSCPGAQTVGVGAGCTALVPDYTSLVTATDNCGIASITQTSPLPGSSISLGATVSVTVQVTDPSGNSRNCVFSLTAVGPEMNVTGNSNAIPDGDVTPSTTDLTDFGSALICGGQVTHTFVIQNTGNSTLDITGFNSTDGSYMVTAYSSPILPGNSGTISIMFQPATAGLHASTISIQNTDCDEAPYNFVVTGYGYESDIDVFGNSVLIASNDITPTLADHTDFGAQTVCAGTVSRTFTIDNNSTPGYAVLGISVNISGANASDFTVTANPASGIPWALQTTTFTVTFDPSAPGLRTATLNVTSNDCDENPYTFAISGFGDDPEMNLVGNSLNIVDGDVTPSNSDHTNFNSVLVCIGTIYRDFTIQNTGNSVLNITLPTITGPQSAEFVLISPPALSIAPASSTTFRVLFNPTGIGPRNATITIANDDCDENPYDFAIQGTGNADVVPPTALCRNISVHLNPSGTANIIPAMIDNGSYDQCGVVSLSINNSSFNCSNVGANTVILTVTDGSGNVATCNSVVTVIDTVRPVANCQNITVQLNPSGNATLIPAMLDGGSTDACGIATRTISLSAVNCSNIGTNNVTLTVTDVNGNSSSCVSVVTVADTVRPVANCQNITVHLNSAGTANITGAMVNNGSTDACGIASLAVSPSSFSCANIGPNTVTLTVTDVNGRTSTCNSIVTVVDTVRPVANCQNITVNLNAAGTANITGAMVNNGSTDACGIASLAVSPSSFSCANIGPNTVTLTVTDVNGRTSTCNSIVTVVDTIRPVVNCQNINAYLNASGTVNAMFPLLTSQTSSDNCGSVSISFSAVNFTCSNIGANSVTVTGTDDSGNSSSCISTVTVLDTIRPATVCQNATITLVGGTASIGVPAINNGSSDACGIASMSVSPNTFDCTDLGANTVTLTVTDVNGNTSTCTSVVTVLSNFTSTIAVNNNVSCNGGNNGQATIAPSGGAEPFTYLWSPSGGTGATSTGLSAGVCTCTITDAGGCTTSQTVSITQPSALVVSFASQTNVSCNGGSNGTAAVTVSGGTTAYSYNWTPGNPTGDGTASVTGLTTGTWTCTVTDANSCVATQTFNVTAPPALVASAASQTNISCFGGSNGAAAVSVVGGGFGYNYDWTPGNPSGDGTSTVTGLTVGTWTCNVIDGYGCTTSQTFNITQPSALTAAATATAISCNGGNATVTVVGAGGTAPYTGTGTFTVTAGTYSYTLTDANGCTVTTSITITEPTALTAAATATSILCNGGTTTVTVTASGGIAPYTGTGTFTETAGTFFYPITDANGCPGSASINISEPPALVATSSAAPILCNGGTTIVIVSGSGGTAPFSGTGAFTVTAGTHSYTVTDANGCTTTTSITVTEPTALTAAATTTSISCNGGNATVTVVGAGGTAPYTGEGSFTVTAGTYSYTVTDANGCTVSTSITITEPTALTATSTATSILCNGGNATVTVVGAGGTAPYTGDGSFTELAGTHSYTVTDANGCTVTTSITITEPTAISTTVVSVNVGCNGDSTGSIDLTVTGGTGPYTFDWNSGTYTTEDLTGLGAGTYVGVLTDANGCTDGGTIVISEPAVLVASITTTVDPDSCGATNGSIDITVSGGTIGYTYLWNTTATTEDLTGVGAGAYSCVVTDTNGCTANVSGNLNDPNAPTVTLTIANDTVCIDDGAFVLAGESPIGGTFSGPGVTAGSFDPTAAGVGMHMISYTFVDVNGCSGSTTDSIYVDVCTSSDIWNLRSEVSIYPNPNDGTFTLQTTSVADVMIYDAQGKLVYAQKVQANVAMQMNIVESGMYMITVIDANGQRTSQRVMVTR